ncbi:lipopolysaccharide biosynthesis protein [Novosphingobium huizhouense]|uniref:lipopolysaccharide biosynthesis protein n=1 Tax=Novosphingobium huizhouense TaxID=2866625 RepID=UPI001CD8231C|nr:hypothetical protein [Novosphingobium huizhouense]
MSSTLARNAASGVAQVIVSAGSLFVTYRLLMDFLSVQEIGLWSLVVGTTAVARLSELGVGNGVLRFVAADVGCDDRPMAASTIGMALTVVSVAVGLVALAAYPFLLRYLLSTTPLALHAGVETLLPAALGSLVVGTTANIFMSGLDGCQRMDVRVGLQMASSVIQLVMTYVVLPRFGLLGLGVVQLAQAGFIFVAGSIGLVLQLRQPLSAYLSWHVPRLKEVLTYGGSVQLSSFAQLLFDPVLKVLLNHFGGLAITGYYDIANRVALQARSLIVAAYNALVPYVAARAGRAGLGPEEIRKIYFDALAVLYPVIVPYFSIVFATLPMALIVWKGHYDQVLLAVTFVQCLAWLLNTINPPAYLIYMALGQMRWIVATHLLVGSLVIVLGLLLGPMFGSYGVLAAGALALSVGSFFVVVMFHREYGIAFRLLVPMQRLPDLVVLLAVLGCGTWLARSPEAPAWTVRLGLPLAVGLFAAGRFWFDPVQRNILTRLRGALR